MSKYQKVLDKVNEFYTLKRELRVMLKNEIISFLKAHDGEVNIYNDGTLDSDLSVSYDGGNHPEYASDMYADVYSVGLNESGTDFYVELEEDPHYWSDSLSTDEFDEVFEYLVAMEENGLIDE